ncbi:RWA3-like protein [Mya arenaria]|uniref:RWA3-like protein n=1 Tax=Mya arenaria TaxID=6604 RepID=A0ABY7FEE7_MYAAR|nr:RWA3-like protein [Mya arenaria]
MMEEVFGRSKSVFDPHTEPHYDVTSGQVAFFLIWISCSFIYILRLLNVSLPFGFLSDKDKVKNDEESANISVKNEITIVVTSSKDEHIKQNGRTEDVQKTLSTPSKELPITKKELNTPVRTAPTIDEFLWNVAIFGAIMILFFLFDYRKGWMQVMFVWYHVFAAKEWYNWIRVYIAAYVWMTGFGNFSFFWVKKDYSLYRFLKMQFRLNFLVTCLCVVTSNEYMLYYICAMHSYWFISVYVFMGTLKSWNTDPNKMLVKFVLYFLFNCAIFEIDFVRNNIFRPFKFLLGYTDRNPYVDDMHEWAFRAGLDHWACFFGMVCAYNYPHFEKFMTEIEKSDKLRHKIFTKAAMIGSCLVALIIWYSIFMVKEKLDYNSSHAYSSLIPIIAFIILRNSFPVLRKFYINLFAWLGKITLETYLAQLHIYLQSNAKHFTGYFPNYHFLNFALATVIYVTIAYKLFNITTVFSAYLIPNDMKKTAKNSFLIFSLFGVTYISVAVLKWL